MDIEDLCRKLKPLIGRRAEQLWMAYLSEDSKGRQELETVIRVYAARILGSDLELPEVHLSAPSATVAGGPYVLGRVTYNGKLLHPFGLREDELIQHVAVFGRSGAGKTNTIVQFIYNLLDNKKPFLIFDWKRNYRDLLAHTDGEILVYTVGRPAVPLAFNPLIPPDGTEPAVWLKKLIEIVAHSYYLGEGVMFLLQEAIHAMYHERGVYKGKAKRYPTFEDVYAWLVKHPVKGRQALWMDSAMRGIKSICFGHMGNVVNTPNRSDLGALLEKNVILELDGLSNADKNLVTESILLWIHHYRLTQPERETFKHAIIIEEAHHILRKQAAGGAEAVPETILREIRELGEAVIIVDQHPSMISVPALGNTYCTIAMNLKHRSDVSAVSAAMLMDEDEQDILGLLPIGAAVVKLQGRWPRPFQLQIPHRKLEKGCIDDSRLLQAMTALGVIVPNSAPEEDEFVPTPGELAEYELALMNDVVRHPYSGVVERYRRLNVSRRRGNAWKESCLDSKLVAPVEIPTRSGRIVLLDLTDTGRRALAQAGVDVPPSPDRSPYRDLKRPLWVLSGCERNT